MRSLPLLLHHSLASACAASSARLASLRHLWRKKVEERSEGRESTGGRRQEIAETQEIGDNFEGLKKRCILKPSEVEKSPDQRLTRVTTDRI